MLSGIFNGIVSFFEFIGNLIDFVINTITSTIEFIAMIPSLLSNISAGSSHLPTVVIPFFAMSITITIVYLVLGRSNNT